METGLSANCLLCLLAAAPLGTWLVMGKCDPQPKGSKTPQLQESPLRSCWNNFGKHMLRAEAGAQPMPLLQTKDIFLCKWVDLNPALLQHQNAFPALQNLLNNKSPFSPKVDPFCYFFFKFIEQVLCTMTHARLYFCFVTQEKIGKRWF